MNCMVDKDKCFEIIETCKCEINKIVTECKGKDVNSAFLAREIIKEMDRLKRCLNA